MKGTFTTSILLFLFLFPALTMAQGGTWVWVNGSDYTGAYAVYGTKGVPNATNTPGGLAGAANWVDLQGNFWVFGGTDEYGYESDMWMYNPVTNIWTWMNGPGEEGQPGSYGTRGVASSTNNPGGRNGEGYSSTTWTDENGNLWLFGGYGYGDEEFEVGTLNDLWMYNTSTKQWTWMNGETYIEPTDEYGTLQVPASSNTPGGRFMCTGWVDNNNDLWLFGGIDEEEYTYNDVWKYNVSTNEWEWMSGPEGTNFNSDYGVIGVASANNLPPSRGVSVHWKDPQGNFYMSGGIYGDGFEDEDYADVWKYNPTTTYWTWVGGSDELDYFGNYGLYCTNNGPTGPSQRWDNPSPQMTGCSSVGLTYGGKVASYEEDADDLWLFNSQNDNWILLSGSDEYDDYGSYGTRGVPSESNLPPSRQADCLWIDNNGILWLFGGYQENEFASGNDMWKFIPTAACLPAPLTGGVNYTLAKNTVCMGDSTLLTLTNISNTNIYPASVASIIDSANIYLFPDSTTTFVITGQSTCSSNDTARVTVHVNTPGQFTYSLTDTDECEGTPDALTLYGLSGVTISPTMGVTWQDSADAILAPSSTTAYVLSSLSSVCGTPDSATFTIHVTAYSHVTVELTDSVVCEDGETTLFITGLSNVSISPLYEVDLVDSTLAYLYPYTDTSYTVTGTTSCGSTYSQTFNVYVQDYDELTYTLSKPDVCAGDSVLITFEGTSGVQIDPVTGVSWITANSAWLFPTVTTDYELSGYLSACGEYADSYLDLQVIQPGHINYTLADSQICGFEEDYLQIFGASNLQIIPATYFDFYYTDSTNAYAYLEPDTTTRYRITGNSVCGSGSDTTYFTVHVLPSVDVYATPPTICTGDSSIITIKGLTDISISPSTGFTWIDSTHILVIPASTVSYDIYGYDCDGYYSYNYITITVNTAGALDYTLDDSDICAGGDAYLYVYGVTSLQITPYAYTYYEGNDEYYSYLEPAETTTYTVVGNSVCGGYDTAHITISVLPEATYSLQTSTICSGDSTLLYFQGFRDFSIYPTTGTYWLDSSEIYLSPATTTTYEISGYDCDDFYETYDVIVTVEPQGGFSYTLSDSILCTAGDEVYVTISGISDPTITPYVELYPDGEYEYYTYLYPDVTTTYTVTGEAYCGGGEVTESFTIQVTPNAYYTLSATTICRGEYDTLNLYGFATSQITPLGNITWNGTSEAYLYPDTTTEYKVSGQTVCDDAYYQPFTVQVHSSYVYITSDTTSVCQGDSIRICASPGFVSYIWSSGQTSTCVNALSSGNYNVTITDQNNCTTQSNVIPINILPAPTVSVTIAGDTLTAIGAQNYQWYDNGNFIPGAESYQYIAAYPGSYSVLVEGSNGCSAFSNAILTAIGNVTIAGSINIYPNPTSGAWTLDVSKEWLGSPYNIYDIDGRVVYSSEIRDLKSELWTDLAKGVYMLKILSATGGTYSVKLIKM